MIITHVLPVVVLRSRWMTACLILAMIGWGCWVFEGYLTPMSLPFILGMAALPFTIRRAGSPRGSKALLVAACIWLLLAALVPVKTLLFFAVGCLLGAWANQFGYQCRLLTVIVWGLLSPMFAYLANAFSFPIRLQLASWCGSLLHYAAVPVSIQGNVIDDGHGGFSIDPGCMGLNMLVASLLLGSMLLGYYEQRLQRTLRLPGLALFFSILILLNVGSNLIRILLLVWFVWMPGTLMHDVAGMICLALYVGVPAWWLARKFVQRSAPVKVVPSSNVVRKPLLVGPSAACLLLSIRVVYADRALQLGPLSQLKIDSYQASEFQPGIVKLDDGKHLVYFKFVRGFYDMDHNPTICWEGSGYTFTNVTEADVEGYRIYTAVLARGDERLYTAWWYSNGTQHTSRQTEWRRMALTGDGRFAVINVTASSAGERQREVERVLKRRLLKPVFDLADRN